MMEDETGSYFIMNFSQHLFNLIFCKGLCHLLSLNVAIVYTLLDDVGVLKFLRTPLIAQDSEFIQSLGCHFLQIISLNEVLA